MNFIYSNDFKNKINGYNLMVLICIVKNYYFNNTSSYWGLIF